MAVCSCPCHPHTKWGQDGSPTQRERHPPCSCVCCGAAVAEAREYVVVTIWKPRRGREVSHAYGLYTLAQANKEKYHLMQSMQIGEGKGSTRVLKVIDLDALNAALDAEEEGSDLD